jgi:hypothetical protein
MSIGQVYNQTQFYARSRSNADQIRLYSTNRKNRDLLFSSFKEASNTDEVSLVANDIVWYAHRHGNVVKCAISCIVYGSAVDCSDRDYQLIGEIDGSVYNTTRSRIVRFI